MKFITALVALTAFAAAHEGDHDAQGNHLDAQGNIITFKNGTKPSYPIPPSQQVNSNGSQNQTKEYPLPPSQNGNNSNGSQGGNNSSGSQNGGNQYPTPNQGGNNSSGNQNGSQGGNQEQKTYPIPAPSQQQGGNNQVMMDEFQKFMQSPMMQKFMEYMKNTQQNKY
ncbi:hypothetical protein CONCODRAFT_3177 [Conidiobolus coronatus NRRL 28638]|uniref:Uncharacterized protein n=1 Tax=Conidiobolus coronatus (strain ATCC 28846 / CBS 209.66 / NRRL 28638) TaxID=796925 RepID=A0A137PFM2_CONC2|nr:hypothetical protein CONCODRAFT_3177 [Conidiobolus coronatus NRRL 28638]|eukprot:KXN73770.1 hypothetical protein CONCODRAFT_3177 [Conidiobolus coronatus NRRL 28638]